MTPQELVPFLGQVVELRFTDGEHVRAHILSVDPDVEDNHLFYDVIQVLEPSSTPHDMQRDIGFACSATKVASVTPTDGLRYAQAPGSRFLKRPWWKFW